MYALFFFATSATSKSPLHFVSEAGFWPRKARSKARFGNGGVMECEEKETLHNSDFFFPLIRPDGDYPPLPPRLSVCRLSFLFFLLFLAFLVLESEAVKSNFLGTFFHASLCTHIHLSIYLLTLRPLDFLHRSLHAGLRHLSNNNRGRSPLPL